MIVLRLNGVEAEAEHTLKVAGLDRDAFTPMVIDIKGGKTAFQTTYKAGRTGVQPLKISGQTSSKPGAGGITRPQGYLKAVFTILGIDDVTDEIVHDYGTSNVLIQWDISNGAALKNQYPFAAITGALLDLLMCAADGVTHTNWTNQVGCGMLANIPFDSPALDLG